MRVCKTLAKTISDEGCNYELGIREWILEPSYISAEHERCPPSTEVPPHRSCRCEQSRSAAKPEGMPLISINRWHVPERDRDSSKSQKINSALHALVPCVIQALFSFCGRTSIQSTSSQQVWPSCSLNLNNRWCPLSLDLSSCTVWSVKLPVSPGFH